MASITLGCDWRDTRPTPMSAKFSLSGSSRGHGANANVDFLGGGAIISITHAITPPRKILNND